MDFCGHYFGHIYSGKEAALNKYIADLHFYDENILKSDGRQYFHSIDAMNLHMIHQWNRYVSTKDIVYVIGDLFTHQTTAAQANAVLQQLKGRICLIEGNHDYKWLNTPGVNTRRFEWVKIQTYVWESRKRTVLLNHYPILFFGNNHGKDQDGGLKMYMMHGHVHNGPENQLLTDFEQTAQQRYITTIKGQQEPMTCNLINCFCEFSDYIPLTLNQWIILRNHDYQINKCRDLIFPQTTEDGAFDLQELTIGSFLQRR